MDTSSTAYAVQLALIALLLLLLAFFWGSETALLAANRLRLENLKERGSARARVALQLTERPAQLLSTVLISNNVVNTGLVVIATMALVTLLGSERGPLAAFAFSTVVLIVVEIVSKSVAAHHADRLALLAARPVHVLSRLLAPLIRVLSFVTNLMSRPFGGHVRPDAPMVTSEEIQTLVRMGEEQGVLEQDEREMIHSIFEFGDTVVREVMVPRVDMVAVEADEPVESLLEIVRTYGHSRIPVYDDTVDHIIGLVHVKDLLAGSTDGRLTGTVRGFVRPAYFVPETKRLDELFREMRRKKVHMAIAVDEYGGTAGLVTIEDLLEEIVGPIQDEYDVEEPPIKVINDRVALVDGAVHLEDVNAALGIELPAGEVDTVGGFVTSLLGHVPTQGERVSHDGVEFAVEQVDGHRIVQVRVTKVQQAPAVD
ncbi:MAG: hemolysin family protein [Armatimonadota bacterium]|nr:hemolysin family protein [Armatimonadota bacterium]